MTQLRKTVDPFGEVNVFPALNNKKRVVATILMEPYKEGAQTGIALDGSGSMKKLYGEDDGSGVVSSIFAKKQVQNEVSPVAQQICAYLARKIDSDGGTTCIYWATGNNGLEVELIKDFTADEAERHVFGPPQEYGTGTYLMPAVRYFVDRFQDAPWGFYVFITDGELFDLEEVKNYSIQFARDVAAGRRNPVKFILIGLGNDINEKQMEELDDLDPGVDVDLWDHKLASELRQLQQIFAEVVDMNARVADNGKILDANGQVVKNFSDTGLPAYLEFEVPDSSEYFTLEVNGNRIHQPLSDTARVPTSDVSAPPTSRPSGATPPPLPGEKSEMSSPPPVAPPQPAAETKEAPQQQQQEPAPEPKKKELVEDANDVVGDKDELWKMIDLEIDPEKGKDK